MSDAADRLLAWNEAQSTPGYCPESIQFRVDLRAVLLRLRQQEQLLDEVVANYQDAERDAAASAAASLARIIKERTND